MGFYIIWHAGIFENFKIKCNLHCIGFWMITTISLKGIYNFKSKTCQQNVNTQLLHIICGMRWHTTLGLNNVLCRLTGFWNEGSESSALCLGMSNKHLFLFKWSYTLICEHSASQLFLLSRHLRASRGVVYRGYGRDLESLMKASQVILIPQHSFFPSTPI